MKNYISGYSGFIPKKKNLEIKVKIQEPHSEIPGYAGYVWANNSENIYGKTFGLMTNLVKCGSYYRNRPHLKNKIFSIYNESYNNPKKVDNSWNLVPTKKKFVIKKKYDVDADNVLANDLKNRLRLSSKKKYSMKNPENSINFKIDVSKNKRETRLTKNNPIVGYTGYIKGKVPNNIYGLNYKKSNDISKNYKDKDNFKENNCKKNLMMNSITGYQGFVYRNKADNLYGSTYKNTKNNIKKSVDSLKYWNNKLKK